MRMLGQKPMRLQPFREYVRVVRTLLDGDEADYALDGESHRVRFQMREHRFIDLDHRIPLYIAAFGPKAQALAGELADGLISGLPRGGTVPGMLAHARRGAERAGRALPDDFPVAAMVTLVMRQPGEAVDSERIVAECGAAVITGLHYLVAHHLETGADPPEYARPIWDGYMKWLDGDPSRDPPSAPARQPLQLRRSRGGPLPDRRPDPGLLPRRRSRGTGRSGAVTRGSGAAPDHAVPAPEPPVPGHRGLRRPRPLPL